MKKHSFVSSILVLIFSTIAIAQGETEWQKALPTEKPYKSDTLLLFTNPEWCPPCAILDLFLFSRPEFADATQKFNRVKITIAPFRAENLTDEEKQGHELLGLYGKKSVPALYLLDSEGRVYFEFHGADSRYTDSEKGIANLKEDFQNAETKRDQAYKLLAKAKEETRDGERAVLLNKALESIATEAKTVPYGWESIAEEAVKLAKNSDSRDCLYIQKKFKRLDLLNQLRAAAKENKTDEAIAITETLLKEFTGGPDTLARLSPNNEQICRANLGWLKVTKGEFEFGIKELERAKEADPSSVLVKQLDHLIETAKEQQKKK